MDLEKQDHPPLIQARKRLTADALVSFTYIPGTVCYMGYGSAFERQEWSLIHQERSSQRPRRVLIRDTNPPKVVPQTRSTTVTIKGQFLRVARLDRS